MWFGEGKKSLSNSAQDAVLLGGFEAFLYREEEGTYLEQDELSFLIDGKLDIERIIFAERLQFQEKLDQLSLPSLFGKGPSFCLVEGFQIIGGTFRDRPGFPTLVVVINDEIMAAIFRVPGKGDPADLHFFQHRLDEDLVLLISLRE